MSASLTEASSLYGGVAQFEAGEQRSNLLRANQGIALAQERSEVEAGNYNAGSILRKGAAIEGQQIANIGANNLQGGGTPAQVVKSTAEVNEMDALMTRNNALRRAWGFGVQGQSDAEQAGFARSAGTGNAIGAILGGSAKAYTESNAAGTWI